jgi:hypothetical protein
MLSELLLKIHDVTHHLGMICNRVPHALLKFKVCIMEKVLRSFPNGGKLCHIVHVFCAIKIML